MDPRHAAPPQEHRTSVLQRSDEDILASFYAGDDRALDLLVARYLPLVRSRAREMGVPGRTGEVTGLSGLWRAVRDYDPADGPWRAWAIATIDAALEHRRRQLLVDRIRSLGAAVDRSLAEGDVEAALTALQEFHRTDR